MLNTIYRRWYWLSFFFLFSFSAFALAFDHPIHDSSVGSTGSQHEVGTDGSANYSIPIYVVPGKSGIQPDLALSYSSNAGNGLLGVGWSLSGLSVIHRCAATLKQDGFIGSIAFDDKDKFCLNGKRLVAYSGAYGKHLTEYRTVDESFSKIVSYGQAGGAPAYFKVWTRSGQTHTYGSTDNSRIEAQGRNSVYIWALYSIEDSFRNYLTIQYFEDQANGYYHPTRIDYTGNHVVGIQPYNSVRFEYEDRSDKFIAYVGGSLQKNLRRLSKVKSYSANTLVREYTLTYQEAAVTKKSQLQSIKECSGDRSCLPETRFTWQNEGTGTFQVSKYTKPSGHNANLDMYPSTGDFNGDGIADLGWAGISANNGQIVTKSYIALASGNGHFGASIVSSMVGSNGHAGEFDGDGITDFGIALYDEKKSTLNIRVSFNKGNGQFESRKSYNFNIGLDPVFLTIDNYVTRYEDLNGDGLTDIVLIVQRKDFTYIGTVLNEGDGVFRKVNHKTLYDSQLFKFANHTTQKPMTADVNGDGLADLLWAFRSEKGLRTYTILNEGGGRFSRVTGSSPSNGNFISYSPAITADYNGDGLTDLVWTYKYNGGLRAYTALSKGDGTFSTAIYNAPRSNGNFENYDPAIIGDFNGDGLTDLVWTYKFNGGIRAYTALGIGNGKFAAARYNAPHTSGNFTPYKTIRAGDFNGDGLTDLAWIAKNNVGMHFHTALAVGEGSNSLMVKVTNGFDHLTAFTYKPMTDSNVYTKNTDATYPIIDLQFSRPVVSRVITSNGIGGVFTNHYTYKGFKVHIAGHGSLGFQEMTTKNVNTGTATTTTFSQNYAAYTQGSVDRVKTVAGNGTVLSDTSNQWKAIEEGTGAKRRYRTQLQRTEVTKRDLNNAFLHREVNSYIYDGFDNLTSLSSKTYDNAGQLLRSATTTNAYVNNTGSSWILGLLQKVTVKEQTTGKTQKIRKSAWTYNTNTGKALTEKILHPSTEAVLQQTHFENIDYFGNHRRTRITGPDFDARQSTMAYDSTGRFVVKATNALGHVATSNYYPDGHINAGMVKTSTDSNQITTHYLYDSFGRATTTTYAYGTDEPIRSRTSFQWCRNMRGLCPARAVYGIVKSSDGGSASRVFIDRLGREIKRSTQALDGRFAHVSSRYNAQGRTESVSEPRFNGSPEYLTTIEYDALGRATRSTDATGRVDTVQYNGLTQTARTDINGLNQKKVETRDSLGQLTMVHDTAGQRISYQYDSSGNMTLVTNHAGNVTRIEYDALGRKEAMDDPDKGLWRYTYNGLGQLLTQTNARGEVTCNAYDLLGRMVRRVDNYKGNLPTGLGVASDASDGCANPGSDNQTTRWTYDAVNALGKLFRVNSPDYQETLVYDRYARETETRWFIAGPTPSQAVTYKVKTQYDALHRPETVTYPGIGLKVETVYNDIGFPVEIKNANNNITYQRVAQTDARGNILEENLGNGLSTFRVYDAITGRIGGIGTYRPLDTSSPSVQHLEFDFDAIGNLTERTDYLQQFSEQFTYDNLNRLRTSHSDFGNGDIRTNAVTYDALGNILSKTGVGNYSYGGTTCGRRAGPHAVTTISAPKATSYCYDANGNMTSGDGRTIQYSYFDKPTLITKGSKSTAFKYGPERNRFQRIDREGGNTTTTTYIGGLYEKVEKSNGSVEERHFIGGSAIVTIYDRNGNFGNTKTRYLHKDHLGSITAITDEQMNLVEEFSFDAWGKRRAPSLARLEQLLNKPWASMTAYEKDNLTLNPWDLASSITNKGFTGHEQLDGVGLIHMNGRVYDAEIGRFLGADPFIQDRTNLQALNRYSYVLNNPLSYTDPSGYFFKKLFKKIGKIFKKAWKGIKNVAKGIFKGIKRQLQAVGKVLNAIPGLSTVVGIAIAIVASPAAAEIYFQALAYLNTAISLANGAPIGDVLTGFAVGMVVGGISGGLGDVLAQTSLGVAGHYVASGLVGGVAAKALGGRFKDGFAGGLLSAGVRHAMGHFDKVAQPKLTAQKGSGDVEICDCEQNSGLDARVKEISNAIGLSDSEFDVAFASKSEIEIATNGEPAWGTVNKNGTILIDKSLATRMNGTRFTQTLAEEMVHVVQIRTGYYKLISQTYQRYAIEAEATGWVISRGVSLGLRGSDFVEYKRVHRMWTRKWKNERY
ncbi:FG-GAP-like repeat-containing protein [Microbulbifer spongiae]|uniref:FG-GAP-like repeat-containing protein n=1 Tax=Microbulbifer spongiae TaxID=2944933 RepID=A0ABY9E8U6_9GAMM|nr:FG-GAP-like repeat-containing protein [Microbulbifer sp. MI-G]WKD48752.1 FG-GAP-like repeat-containing protein [Microbulbifer sp. MI-G]